ncbi:efflux transporter outer membrane subunit [Sphingomonas sp. H160509]|uniref:efflux transporter outer membrane subunit n=1 Tax=Sphingomonas sp. H160509 TaxID=2955313 RepID=UPI0020980C9C|nr:efflux transporter outer membrane subunit [Sphingomonas sp. H160509]MDD1453272.1 efflux transporter outer membrane subunit [Sphingomonas sp. H160509]
MPCLLLSGCLSPPHLGPAPVPKAAQAYLSSQSLAAPVADWPTDSWWLAYGDGQLDALIEEGLKDSPSVAQASARLRRAEAAVGAAGAPLLPSVNADASVTITKPSSEDGIPVTPQRDGYRGYGRATVGFSWELDFWGKNRATLAAARSDAAAATADAAAARLIVSASIAAAYADLVRLYADRDVLQSTLDLRSESLRIVRARTEHGFDSESDLAQAEAGPPAARADLAVADESIGIARNRIAALLGAGPDRGLAIERPVKPSLRSFGLPAALAADLLGRRPDVVAARWRVEAAGRRIKVARAQFYPSVNLLAFIGFDALGLGNLLNAGADVGGAGPALSLPIFDGGRRRANYSGARAEFDAAVATYDDAVVQGLREVADVVQGERHLADARAGAQGAVVATERAYRLAQLRYRMGAADYQSVLLIEDRLLTRRRVLAGFESRAFLLDVALVRSLGGGVPLRSLGASLGDGISQALPVGGKRAVVPTPTTTP